MRRTVGSKVRWRQRLNFRPIVVNVWAHPFMIIATQPQRRMSAPELVGPIVTGYIWLARSARLSFLTSPKLGNDIVVESESDTETTARYIFGDTFSTTWFTSVAIDSTLGALVAACPEVNRSTECRIVTTIGMKCIPLVLGMYRRLFLVIFEASKGFSHESHHSRP